MRYKPKPVTEPRVVDEREERNEDWTGQEGYIWTDTWYKNQQGPFLMTNACATTNCWYKGKDSMTQQNKTAHKGRRFMAIRREDLEQYERLTDDQLGELPDDEFYDLTDAVMSDLARMEDMVKRRKQMFDRMKKKRLAAELEKTKGKVVDLTDMVMMLTEQPGRTSWAKLLVELKEMRPELSALLDELCAKFTGGPVPMIKKYRRTKEPKNWKSLEHVPLKSALTAESDLGSHRALQRLNDFLDKWIDRLGYFLEESLSRAASVLTAEISKDTMAVLNVNAGAKKAATQIMQSVGEAINNMAAQMKPLGDSVDTAPFGVVQNVGALLDDWAQTLTQLKTTTVDSVLQQLTEIGEKLEEDLAAGGRVEVR